jgi:hypothetical protein
MDGRFSGDGGVVELHHQLNLSGRKKSKKTKKERKKEIE